MNKKFIIVLAFIFIFSFILQGCEIDNRTNKEKEIDEIRQTEKNAKEEEKEEYTKELDDMSELLSYLSYALAFNENYFSNDNENSKNITSITTIDDRVMWDTIAVMLELGEHESDYVYEQEEGNDETITIVHMTQEKLTELIKELFGIDKIPNISKDIKYVTKLDSGYDFTLQGIDEKKADFDVDKISATDVDKKTFLLQAKLDINEEETIKNIANGELILQLNEDKKQFPYAIKSINLTKTSGATSSTSMLDNSQAEKKEE